MNDVAGHIDPENVENFSLKDLNRLIKSVAADMGNFDAKRHQQFKEYEMHKAMEREDKLEQMNAYEKAEFEKEEKKRIQRHMENAKIPHPVSTYLLKWVLIVNVHFQFSRDFLEDVWSTFDHLKGETFSPKTFFLLHGIYSSSVVCCSLKKRSRVISSNYLYSNDNFRHQWRRVYRCLWARGHFPARTWQNLGSKESRRGHAWDGRGLCSFENIFQLIIQI